MKCNHTMPRDTHTFIINVYISYNIFHDIHMYMYCDEINASIVSTHIGYVISLNIHRWQNDKRVGTG